MKVVILTEGGKKIGLGHLARCVSLYEEVSRRKIPVDFIINGDVGKVEFLDKVNFITKNWLDKEYLVNNISIDDYVIIDSYKAAKKIYDIVSKLSRKALFIDDIGRIDYPEGIIVNPSLDASNIDYTSSKSSLILAGPKYIILRSPFINVKKRSNMNVIKRVLIVMGGTDTKKLTPLLVKNLSEKKPDLDFEVVIGSNHSEDYYYQLLEVSNVYVHTNINATQMMELMLSSDLAITAAGQTIYELLATQTPFIPIQIIDNQKNNIRSLLKYNPCQYVLEYDDIDILSKLDKALERFSSFEYRKIYNMNYEGLIDGFGSSRIIDILLKDINSIDKINLRKVKFEDIREVFDLSNKDYVRHYSINKDKIDWDAHVHWFNLILKDKTTVFYVVSDKNDSFLGQIRYKITNNNATVSISLTEKLKGKGLSKEILYQSIQKLFEEKITVREIVAYVSKENIPSKKIFEGLSFKLTQEKDTMIRYMLSREDFYVNR